MSTQQVSTREVRAGEDPNSEDLTSEDSGSEGFDSEATDDEVSNLDESNLISTYPWRSRPDVRPEREVHNDDSSTLPAPRQLISRDFRSITASRDQVRACAGGRYVPSLNHGGETVLAHICRGQKDCLACFRRLILSDKIEADHAQERAKMTPEALATLDEKEKDSERERYARRKREDTPESSPFCNWNGHFPDLFRKSLEFRIKGKAPQNRDEQQKGKEALAVVNTLERRIDGKFYIHPADSPPVARPLSNPPMLGSMERDALTGRLYLRRHISRIRTMAESRGRQRMLVFRHAARTCNSSAQVERVKSKLPEKRSPAVAPSLPKKPIDPQRCHFCEKRLCEAEHRLPIGCVECGPTCSNHVGMIVDCFHKNLYPPERIQQRPPA